VSDIMIAGVTSAVSVERSWRYAAYLFCSSAVLFFFFSSRRRHTRSLRDWSSDVCSSDLGDRVVRINATTDPTEVGAAELVVIATKAMDVETAARAARHLLDAETVVLTIQNGVGAAERVASILEIGRASCRERVEL